MSSHLSGCYCRKAQQQLKELEIKCEISGCKKPGFPTACFSEYGSKKALLYLGVCMEHWAEMCDECNWDPLIPRCLNRRCDTLRVSLTERQGLLPADLRKRVEQVPIRPVKRQLDFDKGTPIREKKKSKKE